MGTKITKPGWKFAVEVVGNDLVVYNGIATCFGGDNDAGDNGETASGVRTKGNPSILGCALPILPNVTSTKGSPFPKLPWKTSVEVIRGATKVRVPLIDNGPAKSTGNAIDLTVAAAKCFASHATANNFKTPVTFRVIGGAKYLPAGAI